MQQQMQEQGSRCRVIVAQTSAPGEQGAPRDPSETVKLRGRFSSGRDVRERLRSHFSDHEIELEIWDESAGFTPLEDSMDLRSMAAVRVLVRMPGDGAGVALAIEGRAFDDSDIRIAGKQLVVHSISNSSTGTGHNTWDGAIVLAKYLELHAAIVQDKYVLELGAGTGLAGIAAAVLGANAAVLTDLPYVIANLRDNIDANNISNAQVAELDWMKLEEHEHVTGQRRWDVVLCADVVWLEQLVQPLVQTLRAVSNHSSEHQPLILMSYQKRSDVVHEALMTQLAESGFIVTEIDSSLHHPSYSSPKIVIYEITRS